MMLHEASLHLLAQNHTLKHMVNIHNLSVRPAAYDRAISAAKFMCSNGEKLSSRDRVFNLRCSGALDSCVVFGNSSVDYFLGLAKKVA